MSPRSLALFIALTVPLTSLAAQPREAAAAQPAAPVQAAARRAVPAAQARLLAAPVGARPDVAALRRALTDAGFAAAAPRVAAGNADFTLDARTTYVPAQQAELQLWSADAVFPKENKVLFLGESRGASIFGFATQPQKFYLMTIYASGTAPLTFRSGNQTLECPLNANTAVSCTLAIQGTGSTSGAWAYSAAYWALSKVEIRAVD